MTTLKEQSTEAQKPIAVVMSEEIEIIVLMD